MTVILRTLHAVALVVGIAAASAVLTLAAVFLYEWATWGKDQ